MRNAHRLLGLLAVVPLLAWLLSGLVLAVLGPKGEEGRLVLPMEPLSRAVTVYPEAASREVRLFASPLGNHLLQRTDFGWRHLDPSTGRLKEVPTESQLRSLLGEAFEGGDDGFGDIELVTADSVVTSTGRVITLDWPSFTATYTDRTAGLGSFLRKVHGFAILGRPEIDRWFMVAAAALGTVLAFFGLALLMSSDAQPDTRSGRNRRDR